MTRSGSVYMRELGLGDANIRLFCRIEIKRVRNLSLKSDDFPFLRVRVEEDASLESSFSTLMSSMSDVQIIAESEPLHQNGDGKDKDEWVGYDCVVVCKLKTDEGVIVTTGGKRSKLAPTLLLSLHSLLDPSKVLGVFRLPLDPVFVDGFQGSAQWLPFTAANGSSNIHRNRIDFHDKDSSTSKIRMPMDTSTMSMRSQTAQRRITVGSMMSDLSSARASSRMDSPKQKPVLSPTIKLDASKEDRKMLEKSFEEKKAGSVSERMEQDVKRLLDETLMVLMSLNFQYAEMESNPTNVFDSSARQLIQENSTIATRSNNGRPAISRSNSGRPMSSRPPPKIRNTHTP
eukprot:CAMPEP_0167758086 /NCGR_PEP_ID=MMETSP0110_2-20121227/10277_1 /TAXON_ID=629695 /ORGANISM="Gymnochlora sp., Strain CCMP2014" /LENGTH=344 /DNA_ID=CAMNT_0007644331 /DNA_START=2127 /DNA_END=3161 /DNA_ORIENTATION=-